MLFNSFIFYLLEEEKKKGTKIFAGNKFRKRIYETITTSFVNWEKFEDALTHSLRFLNFTFYKCEEGRRKFVCFEIKKRENEKNNPFYIGNDDPQITESAPPLL